MFEIIVTSCAAFISTNLDDLFLLMIFFSLPQYRSRDVYAGQYMGILTLILVAWVIAYLGRSIDPRYIGLMGLFPLYLGIRHFMSFKNSGDTEDETIDMNRGPYPMFAVAGITIANGGDNIAIYVPFLATLAISEKVILILIFLVLIFIWCWLAQYLARHRFIAIRLSQWAKFLLPWLLIFLGIYILTEAGSFTLL